MSFLTVTFLKFLSLGASTLQLTARAIVNALHPTVNRQSSRTYYEICILLYYFYFKLYTSLIVLD